MFEDSALSAFDLPLIPLEPVIEPANEAARSSLEVREPKSAKELAAQYQVSDRTFQDWFKTVCSAYSWVLPTDLKTGNSNKTRYTVLCQDLIAQYRDQAKFLSADDWIKSVHTANPDRFQPSEITEAELVDEQSTQGAITIHSSQQPISVHQVNQIHLTVINTQPQVDQALAKLQDTLSRWGQNTANLESALIQTAENKGSELGAKVAVAKVSKVIETSEQVEKALAEQLGLLGKPQPVPDFPS